MVAMTPPRDETATAPAPTLRNTGKVEPESAANEVQNGRARIAGEDIKYIKTNAFLLPTKSDKEDQKPAPTTKNHTRAYSCNLSIFSNTDTITYIFQQRRDITSDCP
jgi:hypothetical protein